MIDIPVSVLELAIVNEDSNWREAIDNSMLVAQNVEKFGYKRIWYAEHHNMPYIASSATAVLIGHIADKTKKIRVGSGGIMLPNHSPLMVAEQFGTLESLYPGRIDLGLGRAPGTDQLTANALRRNHIQNAQNFPSELEELQNYFQPKSSEAKVHAYPGEGLNIPLWILGSSTTSAQLAARKGLPYAFATHFAPTQFLSAIDIYRANFESSTQLNNPHLMACVNLIAADTDEEAEHIASSYFNIIVGLATGQIRKGLLAPGEISNLIEIPEVQHAVQTMTAYTFVGSKEKIGKQLKDFILQTNIDELMITSHIYDIEAKIKSFKILSELFD
ncbi:MAG: LLM class flavin-dependent oxidoreductase [Moheibacter sp.]